MRSVIVCTALLSLLAGCGDTEEPAPSPVTPVTSETTAGAATKVSGGGDARTKTANPLPRAFGASCTADSECDSSTCFLGGHGGFCSTHCSADGDCSTPSSGTPHCNPHGFCRY